jgi:hypothetical protein
MSGGHSVNEVLSDEDVARRYARSNPGYRLISYHPAAVRVYRLLVRVLKMVRSELPILDEFILRSIDAGLITADAIASVLGLEEQIVERALGGLQNTGLVYRGASAATVSHRLLLTPRGVEVLRKRQIDHPAEDDVWVEMDGMTGSISMLTPWRPDAAEVTREGFVVIDPLPRLTPKPDEIKKKRLIHEAWKKSEPRYDLIDVLDIVKREPCFREDGLILAFIADDTQSIRYELVIDGVLSEEHGQAFRTRLAKKPDPRFPSGIASEASTELPNPENFLEQALATSVSQLTEAHEQAEYRVEEISARIRETTHSDTVKQLREDLEALQLERDALANRISSLEVKHLGVADHPKYLQEALDNCKDRLMIISPWVTRTVVNNRFQRQLEAALQRGVQVYIGFGINDDSDERNNNEAVSDLYRLARRFKNFKLVHLGDTHAKVLLCDSTFVITGSFNWLSFRGDPNWKPRDEQSWYIGVPDKIEEQFQFNLKRLEAAMQP